MYYYLIQISPQKAVRVADCSRFGIINNKIYDRISIISKSNHGLFFYECALYTPFSLDSCLVVILDEGMVRRGRWELQDVTLPTNGSGLE